nr:14200_t:CDS:2 [Entrophospora candida]
MTEYSLLFGLTDLDYEFGHREHTYFEYLLPYNGQSALTSEDNAKNIALLEAYHPEDINSQYRIRVVGNGFTPLRPILDIDVRQKPDSTNPELPSLGDTSSSNIDKCSWHIIYPYARLVDYRDLRSFTEKSLETLLVV